MSFDHQVLDFSLWKRFTKRFIEPFSLFEGRDSPCDFVENEVEFRQRRKRIGEFQRALSLLSLEDRSKLFGLEQDRIPNISSVLDSGSLPGFCKSQIRLISLFIIRSESLLGILRAHGLTECSFPRILLSSAEDLVPHLEEDGSISDSHPELLAIANAIKSLSRSKDSYKREFISRNRSLMASSQGAYKNGRDYFVFSKDKAEGSEIWKEVEKRGATSSKSGKSLYVQTTRLREFSDAQQRLFERMEQAKREIIRRCGALYWQWRELLSAVLEECLDADFHIMICEAISAHGLRESDIGGAFRVDGAFNPLLDDPVPFSFSSDLRRFLVTGANGGGKTAFLRSVCLLALQNQLMTFVFARGDCSIPLFKTIALDVFDKQSIEKGLSGFTSRIKDLAEMSWMEDPSSSLFVADEIERGTSDKDASALYEALSSFSSETGFFMFVSTHSSRIKEKAFGDDSAEKISFPFDNELGRNSFRAIKGLCFETSARSALMSAPFHPSLKNAVKKAYESCDDEVGLGDIIERAEKLSQEERIANERAEAREKSLSQRERELDRREREYDLKLIEVLEKEKAIALAFRKLESDKRSVQRNANGAASESKDRNAMDGKTASSDFSLMTPELADSRIADAKSRLNSSAEVLQDAQVREGDEVIVIRNGVSGVVVEAEDARGKVKVALGNVIMALDRYEIRKSGKSAVPSKASRLVSFSDPSRRPKAVLDLRGKRREDALGMLEEQLDAVTLFDMPFFSIICGNGEGVLRKACAEVLSRNSERFAFAISPDGGRIEVKAADGIQASGDSA